MKKFIAAFDGLKFNKATLHYALDLTKQCDAQLVGIFLDDFMRRSYGMAEIAHYAGNELDTHIQQWDKKDEAERARSVAIFEDACLEKDIPFSVHHDENVALQDLLQETVYADLLFIGACETLTRFEEPAPTRFIRDLLNNVQCPVVLTPATYHPVNKIILLYDGEPSSVHAVRMFSYLFEKIKCLETEILTVIGQKDDVRFPDERLIKEFIKQHYPLADRVVLKGNPEDVIIAYLLRDKKNPMVVLGAYQRSPFSRLFKPSMADRVLEYVKNMPLFIAHNKS
jgi:nucleotide-binding universal stress UspA family protein